MSTQCCRNPIGFVRANCDSLNALVENLDAILNAAGEGPLSGLTCDQAIVCINNAIANGHITKNDPNINAVSGSYNPVTGILTIQLSDGSSFDVVGWCPDSAPVEINPGGAFPNDTDLTAAANSNCPGTILFWGGTVKDPHYVWIVSFGGNYSFINTNQAAIETFVSVVVNDGDQIIPIALSAPQQALGFTTSHITSHVIFQVDSLLNLGIVDIINVTPFTCDILLSGSDDVDNGHLLKVVFRQIT